MTITLEEVQKDAHKLALLKTFMTAEHNIENLDFLLSRKSNDKLYPKYIDPASHTQVNLHSALMNSMKANATAKKWAAMGADMGKARVEITKLVNRDTMRRFETSKASIEYSTIKGDVAKMETDMAAAIAFFASGTAAIKSKGLPAKREEVNRMFDSARMRADKVNEAFTEMIQKHKGVTRSAYAKLFADKDEFAKEWAAYRKLLGR